MTKLIYERIPKITIAQIKRNLSNRKYINLNVKGQSYTLQIDYSPCHFGGSRPWFICPCCGHRMAYLLFYNHKFGCRHCLNTCYSIENKTPIDRQRLREQRLLSQLDCDSYSELTLLDCLRKPKGMHFSTFEKKKHIVSTIHSRNTLLLRDLSQRLLAQERRFRNKIR